MINLVLEIGAIANRGLTLILNLIFPQRCAGCDTVSEGLCTTCRQQLEKIFIQGKLVVNEFHVFFSAGHSEILKKVLHRFKYKSDETLITELGKLLVRRMNNVKGEISGLCMIMPTPLHHRRERERGFNQSELLAKMVAREIGYPLIHLLERKRETKIQATLSRKERIDNVKGAFGMRKNFIEKMPEAVFVLDDVITTGSTFVECARVLRAAGVKRVYGIMLAHGL